MSPPRFAVVGTGRSGTAYTAAVLRACGVLCGHENWWTPLPERRMATLDGDSSWMALPDVESGAWSGPVVHVVREPVATVRALLGIEFFGHPDPDAHRRFAYEHEPCMAAMEPLEAAVHWWTSWNARCAAAADVTVRVEQLPQRLGDVGTVIGRRLSQSAAERIARDVNTGRRADNLDERAVRALLDGHTERFGYRA